VSISASRVISTTTFFGALHYTDEYRRQSEILKDVGVLACIAVGSTVIGVASGTAIKLAGTVMRKKLPSCRVLLMSQGQTITLEMLQLVPVFWAMHSIPDIVYRAAPNKTPKEARVIETGCILGFTAIGMVTLAAIGVLPMSVKSRVIRKVITKM
jgi:hypothetical protein